MLFSELGLNSAILKSLETAGYSVATPIQIQAIPPIIAGRDVLGSAQTGTGKTAAFALPTLQRIAELKAGSGNNKSVIRCLVLVPTRELALQVNSSFNKYGRGGIGGVGGVGAPLRFAVAYGGVKQGKQADALRSGVDVLVATPGRLEDLHQQGLVDLSNVALFILDEADQMLDMGFIIPIRRIAKLCPPPAPNGTRQTLMFSATMPFEIKRLATEMMRNFLEISVAPVAATTELIAQQAFRIESNSKSNLLRHYLKEQNVWKSLVFSRTKHGADRVTRTLQKAGITAAAIHGNRSQPQRTRALEAFKKGDVSVLVATDVAARGLHISEVSHVINYDMPQNAETYIHRIGRTGRAGSTGTAVSFVSGEDRGILRDIERLIKKPLEVLPLPPLPALTSSAPIDSEDDHDLPEDSHDSRPAPRGRPQRTAYAAARPASTGNFDRPQSPPPFRNNDRPRGNFERPAFNNDRPRFNNDRPRFNNDRPAFNNDRPRFNSDRPAFNDRAPHRDDRSSFRDDRSQRSNDRPFNGDRPSFNNNRPNFRNDRPAFNNDRPAFNNERAPQGGDRPAPGADRPSFGHAGPRPDHSAPRTASPKTFGKFKPAYDKPAAKSHKKTFAKPPAKTFATAAPAAGKPGKPANKGPKRKVFTRGV